MEELKQRIQELRESIDRGFDSAEVQAKARFDELIAKIDEITLAEIQRFDELTAAIGIEPSGHQICTSDEQNLVKLSRRLEALERARIS
jgi:hypothetical protein